MNETQTIFNTANSILNQMPFPMMIVNHEGIVAAWNRQAEKTFGYSVDEVLGTFVPFIEQEQAGLHRDGWIKLLRSPDPCHLDKVAFIAKNKEVIFSSALVKAFTIENERYVFFHFEMNDEIQNDPSPYQELISMKTGLESSFMMLTMDQEGLITFANSNFLKRSKWTPKRIIGKTFWQMFPQTDDGTVLANNIWASLKSGKNWKGEVEKMAKDGESYWVDLTAIPIFVSSKNPAYFILLENDITEKKLLQNRLEKIAYIDQETGLMNRYRLEQIVTDLIQENNHFTFVYLSLDKFYSLKEIYDEQTEIVLLQEFTNRMKMYFQDSTMARVSIDEFVVLTPLGEWFIQGFLAYLKQHPIYVKGLALPLSISGGITKYPEDQSSFSHLVKASHAAIYKVRSEGGGNIISLTKADHKALSTKALIEKRLLIALDEKNLKVLYQPQLNLATGKITGVEAFVRWEDEEIGIVTPDVLIPIAEETGLINDIGTFMLEQACLQAATWHKKGLNLKVSINSSVREFRDKNMVLQIRKVLEKTNCPANLLQIEITEKFALEAEAETSIIQQMKQLEADGIVFVLDDFGTGYASFRYMQLLPLAEIKIDQTFISTLEYQKKVQKLIQGIIQFGKTINMRVLAEGVETAGQQELLAGFGCDAVQGYHISHPVTPREIEKLLK
ncbi:EAL domain-containing protein [Viridibacillus sp. YIM B01967]|uniref:EAL domain-containing protein n=1 Tax=Viridibacillus soli TaxID=2798301 RepID=A0ABS1H7V1_9BACL|nr:bifunctional diguanylate cyclase/phosphodiesterase [Viridibacillus soli]MBK3495502.1 EAL domain-containing protein [Viridibacillus soli]